ncbi:hypothetical protein C8C98_1150 [Acidovorax sp. 106]|nr:hypothetical protein C8C98_1150 [Acidovorax sp. 106]
MRRIHSEVTVNCGFSRFTQGSISGGLSAGLGDVSYTSPTGLLR